MAMTKEKSAGTAATVHSAKSNKTHENDTTTTAEVNPGDCKREIMRLLKEVTPVKVMLIYHFVRGFVGEEAEQK